MNLMMENNGMRDIVERLELQAFVADKIQSGMKPLIMDCLEEITHLRCQYEALHNQAEMNARLLTENSSLRAENEKLRKLVKDAYYEAYRDRDSLGDAGTDDPEDRSAWRLSAAYAALGETDE